MQIGETTWMDVDLLVEYRHYQMVNQLYLSHNKKYQRMVALSTSEAEYMAVSMCIK